MRTRIRWGVAVALGCWLAGAGAGVAGEAPPRVRNEAAAIRALRAYAVAQAQYFKAGYEIDGRKRRYADTLGHLYQLGGVNGKVVALLPESLALATTPERAYRGYFFFSPEDSLRTGEPVKWDSEFHLLAVPAEYGVSGTYSLYLDQTGTVLRRDLGRQTEPADYADERVAEPDSGWTEAPVPPDEPLPAGGEEGGTAIREPDAIALLKTFATAQSQYLKAGYEWAPNGRNRRYASRLHSLFMTVDEPHKQISLIPEAFADASTPDKAYRGYYFVLPETSLVTGAPINWVVRFECLAIPRTYGVDGKDSYFINERGTVRMKNMGGQTGPADYANERPLDPAGGWVDA